MIRYILTLNISISFIFLLSLFLNSCSPESNDNNDNESLTLSNNINIDDDISKAQKYLEEAKIALNTGDDPLARQLLSRAKSNFEAANDSIGIANTLLEQGTLERYLGQGQIARDLYKQANAIFIKSDYQLGQGRIAYAIGELERARFNNQESLESFIQAVSIFSKTNEFKMEADSLIGVGDTERRLGNIINSRDAISRARAIFYILDDPKGIRIAKQAWDELFTYFDDYDENRKKVNNELATAQQVADLPGEAMATYNLAIVEVGAGRPDAARDNFQIAINLFNKINDKKGLAMTYLSLGQMEDRLEKSVQAKIAYEEALALYSMHGTTNGMILSIIGLSSLDLNNSQSEDVFSEAQKFFTSSNEFLLSEATYLLEKGNLYLHINRNDLVLESLDLALKYFKELNENNGIARTLFSIGTYYQNVEDIENAQINYYKSLQEFTNSRDRIGEGKARFKIANILALNQDNYIESKIQYRISMSIFKELGMESSYQDAFQKLNLLN